MWFSWLGNRLDDWNVFFSQHVNFYDWKKSDLKRNGRSTIFREQQWRLVIGERWKCFQVWVHDSKFVFHSIHTMIFTSAVQMKMLYSQCRLLKWNSLLFSIIMPHIHTTENGSQHIYIYIYIYIIFYIFVGVYEGMCIYIKYIYLKI